MIMWEEGYIKSHRINVLKYGIFTYTFIIKIQKKTYKYIDPVVQPTT